MSNQSTAAPKFEAAITFNQIDAIDDALNAHRSTMRLMLFLMSLNSSAFIEKSKALISSSEDAYIDVIESISDYDEKISAISELSHSAIARLLLVGEHISNEG